MHLERFPGSIRDVMQVVQMSPESLMKRGNTISLGIRSLIYKIGSSDKGCILFSLYLSIYICTLWNFVKFDILGKLFSGNIQLHRQHGMRTSFYRECWKWPKLCQFHQINDMILGTSKFGQVFSGHFPSCVECSPLVIWWFIWLLECFEGKNMGCMSRISRVAGLLGWNGPVKL